MLPKIFIIFATLAISVFGVQVVFDTADDIAKILQVSCSYADNYADFGEDGCTREPEENLFPEKTGYWTGCETSCSLIYYGGLLPKPQKLWISTYMTGSPAWIEISGKSSPGGDEGDEWTYGYIDSDRNGWCYEEINLAAFPGQDAAVSGKYFDVKFRMIWVMILIFVSIFS